MNAADLVMARGAPPDRNFIKRNHGSAMMTGGEKERTGMARGAAGGRGGGGGGQEAGGDAADADLAVRAVPDEHWLG